MSLTSSVTAQQASGGFAADRPGAIRIDTVSHRYGPRSRVRHGTRARIDRRHTW